MHFSLTAIETNGVLFLDPNGDIPVTIETNIDDAGNKTASIVYHGTVQGFAIYDSTGTTVVSIMPAGLGYEDNQQLMQSLSNITACM